MTAIVRLLQTPEELLHKNVEKTISCGDIFDEIVLSEKADSNQDVALVERRGDGVWPLPQILPYLAIQAQC